jgi:hypothetical protein
MKHFTGAMALLTSDRWGAFFIYGDAMKSSDGSEKILNLSVLPLEFPLTSWKMITTRASSAFKWSRRIDGPLRGLVRHRVEIFFLGWMTGGFLILLQLVLSYRYDLAAGAGILWLCGILLTAAAVLNDFPPRS